MPHQHDEVWMAITIRRAEVLRELAEMRTEREVADILGVSLTTVRSHVEDLKAITGCDTVREMGRWWLSNRQGWAAWVLSAGGVSARELEDIDSTGT